MKHFLILLLFELSSTVFVFSQNIIKEFVVEKDDNPQVIYKSKGCTPDVGVIVFYTTIPDLKFSMPDTPNRLKNISAFDKVNNCYVLCIQPTDTKIGGIMQYSLAITATGYKPMPALMVKGITSGVAQYFKVNPKMKYNENTVSSREANTLGNETITSKNEKKHTTSAPPAPVYSAMTWYKEGKSNSDAGNYSEAKRCYHNALDLNPAMYDAWEGLADACFHLGDYTGAIEGYKKVVENRPSASVWYNMGIAYDANKNSSEALKCYQKAAQFGHKEAQELLRKTEAQKDSIGTEDVFAEKVETLLSPSSDNISVDADNQEDLLFLKKKKITDKNGRILSKDEIRRRLENVPEALTQYNKGRDLRATGIILCCTFYLSPVGAILWIAGNKKITAGVQSAVQIYNNSVQRQQHSSGMSSNSGIS